MFSKKDYQNINYICSFCDGNGRAAVEVYCRQEDLFINRIINSLFKK